MNHETRETSVAAAAWRTSSYSGGTGDCVEISTTQPGVVRVRDSKQRGLGPELAVATASFAAMLAALGDSARSESC